MRRIVQSAGCLCTDCEQRGTPDQAHHRNRVKGRAKARVLADACFEQRGRAVLTLALRRDQSRHPWPESMPQSQSEPQARAEATVDRQRQSGRESRW
jgi:hypothetical protein